VQWTGFVVVRDECVEAELQLVGTTEDGRGWGGRRFTVRGELEILNKPQNATLGHASQHSSVVER